jgi:hypothetical protein
MLFTGEKSTWQFNKLAKTNHLWKSLEWRETDANANSEEYTITKPAKITHTVVDFKINESVADHLVTVKDSLCANIFETIDLK